MAQAGDAEGMSQLPEPRGGAVLSECERYRFSLWRAVPLPPIGDPPRPRIAGRGAVLFVMNNPSTADTMTNDATIRRCMGFAASWGYGMLYVANTNPFRSTDPKAARMPPSGVLEQNDEWLRRLAGLADLIVAAWGAAAEPTLAMRALTIVRYDRPVHALGLTAARHPKHPLRLRRDLQPQLWKVRMVVGN